MNLWRVGIDEISGRSSIERVGLDPASGRVTEPPRPVFRGSRVIYTQDISPKGDWIAFSTLGGREDLFVVRSDGTGYRQITDDAARDRGPKWSPDGTRIAFYSDRSGRYETWTIRPDGGGLEQLTKATGPARTEVTWSRDGSMLAGGLTFYASPNSVTLLYSFDSHSYRPLPEGRGNPVWMSDSRRLLVAQSDRIVMLDTRSGHATPVLAVGAQGISLSRDDHWLTYIENQTESDVWIATLGPEAGGKHEARAMPPSSACTAMAFSLSAPSTTSSRRMPRRGHRLEETLKRIRRAFVLDVREWAPECPNAVARYFARALHRDPRRRPPSATALAQELRELISLFP